MRRIAFCISIFFEHFKTKVTKENEENIRWIRDEFGAEVLPLDVAEDWNITGNLLPGEHFPVYRFLPYKTKGEGFFLAVLRKPGISVI